MRGIMEEERTQFSGTVASRVFCLSPWLIPPLPTQVFSRRLKSIQSLSLTVDADMPDVIAFAKHLETTHGGLVRIYMDGR